MTPLLGEQLPDLRTAWLVTRKDDLLDSSPLPKAPQLRHGCYYLGPLWEYASLLNSEETETWTLWGPTWRVSRSPF